MSSPRRADLRQEKALKNTLKSWVEAMARSVLRVVAPVKLDATTKTISLAELTTMGTDSQITRVKTSETGWEYVDLGGATDQIIITHEAGAIVIALAEAPDVVTAYKVNGVQVVGAQQAAIPDVSAADITAAAGATYTATEQGMLDDLKALANEVKADVDNIKSVLRAHGSIAT